MLNRTGAALISLAVALVVASLPNGNLFVAGFALVPLLVLAMGRKVGRIAIEATINVPPRALRVAEAVEVHVEYVVAGGVGTTMITQPLPDEFELVEGSNIVLRSKGLGRKRGSLRFTIRCRRRGRFALPGTTVELVPALHLAGTTRAAAPTGATMEFKPDLARFTRIAGGQMIAKQFMPNEDRAKLGMKTSDFRDLRDYRRGDAPKTINWTATARRASGQAPGTQILPLVNEYESEGQRNVWVFLDCGPHMAVGSNVENAFEAAVQGAGSIAQFFVDRGFSVGFSLFNNAEPMHLYPDSGRRQMLRIEQELHRAETSTVRGQLGHAARRVKGFLQGGSTWVVVVTRAEGLDGKDLDDVRRLRNATATRRGGSRLMLISPDPYGFVPFDPDAAKAVRTLQTCIDDDVKQAVKRMGVRFIHWDPQERPLHAHLVGARR